ncbi:MAG: DUF5331 domain-containing protein [Leptolyngbyaceae cyanobacterium SM1_1_3]|nr:DUF5331 domain-containing protein [Leptolyngbyaceae cyanobacterium SM1_1_3]NJN02000.1 DUF5331 domain-containing protein [Leptolyngbyaceae cyanobacterium RM1_1_2]NJO08278.1 DUF5331 domain-containing protein [Leptolyngbyaceae cyanobacterium SL_1_1]
MNTEQLRQILRQKWLDYYCENRSWLVRLGVWVTYQGQRRPSSSFILATLAILEPQLNQLLPLVVDLSSNPDRIVAALGLNFNPDEALESLPEQPKMLPEGTQPAAVAKPNSARPPLPREMDESGASIRPRPKVHSL